MGVAEKAIKNVSESTKEIETATVKEATSSISKVALKWIDENGKYIWPLKDEFEGTLVRQKEPFPLFVLSLIRNVFKHPLFLFYFCRKTEFRIKSKLY
ncbi:MAG: hypothetical protein ACPL3A_06695 [Thermoanaerobacteraceae bacterium]